MVDGDGQENGDRDGDDGGHVGRSSRPEVGDDRVRNHLMQKVDGVGEGTQVCERLPALLIEATIGDERKYRIKRDQ